MTQGSGSTHVGIAACTAFGAVLAIIENSEENALVSSLGGESLWIGLSRASSSPFASESFWVWGDGSTVPTYRNWAKAKVWDHYGNEPNGDAEDIGDGKGLCVRQFNQRTNGEWGDDDCTKSYKIACSMAAEQSCHTKQINETETMRGPSIWHSI